MRTISTPQELTALKLECVSRVKWYVDYCKTKLGIYMPYPKVVFGLKGTTAGYAMYHSHLINFQPSLLADNIDTFLEQTVGHEVGHLAAFRKFGGQIKPHGKEWTSVMWGMHLPAKRCHNYETDGVASRLGTVRNNVAPIQATHGVVNTFGMGKVVMLD